jgi:hypothetical protein
MDDIPGPSIRYVLVDLRDFTFALCMLDSPLAHRFQ